MKDADWREIRRDKDALASRNASRPFAEKLATLDRLREMARDVRGGVSRDRKNTSPLGRTVSPRKKK